MDQWTNGRRPWATVNENMLYTNAIGAVVVFGAAAVYEGADAVAYMTEFPAALVLLFVRSVTFWMGAWLYTMLVKHFGGVVHSTRRELCCKN